MADKRNRRRFTPEFKAPALKRVLDGRGLSEVATELGLSTGQLSTWRAEHLAAGSAEALAQRKADNRQRLHSALGYRTPAEARASLEGITTLAA